MNKKYKVAGIGEVLWDQLPQGDVLGGAPANVAYHAGQLGAESYINDGTMPEYTKELGYRINSFSLTSSNT
jgi:hypothetical protein